MSYLRYLCLFMYSGVQHILCCVFVLLFFVMLQVYLDYPFLTAPSVFCIMFIITLNIIVYNTVDSTFFLVDR